MPAVSRPFCFPFDISISQPPTLTKYQASNVHAFLCLGAPTAQFSKQVLRLLTEERRAAHCACINDDHNPVFFEFGDLVMAHVQVTSNAAFGTVAKLSYRQCGPYVIVEAIGTGAYIVCRHDSPTAATKEIPYKSPLSPSSSTVTLCSD
jgi:hypothetical protein